MNRARLSAVPRRASAPEARPPGPRAPASCLSTGHPRQRLVRLRSGAAAGRSPSARPTPASAAVRGGPVGTSVAAKGTDRVAAVPTTTRQTMRLAGVPVSCDGLSGGTCHPCRGRRGPRATRLVRAEAPAPVIEPGRSSRRSGTVHPPAWFRRGPFAGDSATIREIRRPSGPIPRRTPTSRPAPRRRGQSTGRATGKSVARGGGLSPPRWLRTGSGTYGGPAIHHLGGEPHPGPGVEPDADLPVAARPGGRRLPPNGRCGWRPGPADIGPPSRCQAAYPSTGTTTIRPRGAGSEPSAGPRATVSVRAAAGPGPSPPRGPTPPPRWRGPRRGRAAGTTPRRSPAPGGRRRRRRGGGRLGSANGGVRAGSRAASRCDPAAAAWHGTATTLARPNRQTRSRGCGLADRAAGRAAFGSAGSPPDSRRRAPPTGGGASPNTLVAGSMFPRPGQAHPAPAPSPSPPCSFPVAVGTENGPAVYLMQSLTSRQGSGNRSLERTAG